MKTIRLKSKFFGLTVATIAAAGFASCSNELNDADLGNNQKPSIEGISLVKSPDVVTWSGDQTLGNTFGKNINSYSTRAGVPTVERYQSDRDWENVPELISEAESNYVLQYLAEHPNQGYDEFDCDTYYIQVVGGSYEEYTTEPDRNGATQKVTGSEKMNYLVINGTFTWYNNNRRNSEDIIRISNVPAANCSYTDSNDGNSTRTNYKFYFITLPNEPQFGDLAGKTQAYLCFDYMTLSQNGAVKPDGKYNDWVIKLTPADGSVVVVPGSGDTIVGDGDEEDDDSNNDVVLNHDNEVEVNYAILDSHTAYDVADLVTKLSIHVRHATDVDIKIPVPAQYVIESDDLYIFREHFMDGDGNGIYGGFNDEENPLADQNMVVGYEIAGTEVKLHVAFEPGDLTLGPEFTQGYIHVWTEGINQAVIDSCRETNKDGINFEIYNYFHVNSENGLTREALFGYMNGAVIEFLDSNPDYYINAFGWNDAQDNFHPWHAEVKPVEKENYSFAYRTHHLNSTPFNDIYLAEGVTADDIHLEHE